MSQKFPNRGGSRGLLPPKHLFTKHCLNSYPAPPSSRPPPGHASAPTAQGAPEAHGLLQLRKRGLKCRELSSLLLPLHCVTIPLFSFMARLLKRSNTTLADNSSFTHLQPDLHSYHPLVKCPPEATLPLGPRSLQGPDSYLLAVQLFLMGSDPRCVFLKQRPNDTASDHCLPWTNKQGTARGLQSLTAPAQPPL